MKTPNKYSYENALETVKKFEERKQLIQKLNKQLASKLKQFELIKFKVNKKTKEIVFTGYIKEQNKLVLGQSKCKSFDMFEEVIGKLIAVQKSLGESIEDVTKFVESDTSMITFDTKGLTIHGGTITGTSINPHTIAWDKVTKYNI